MGHDQKKEDERIEKVIRGLLKLPENRRCINCNLLGPQYVCTTFSTFVCTNCSGIHREFTHRVKSVSMAKFTPEEVTALQAGGNEIAKQIYLKEWDALRNSYPDSWNMHRLRDFIKHVYVDRKFTGETSQSSLPRIRLNYKEDTIESKKSSSFRLEYKIPKSSSSARSDDANFRYVYDESKSPKYARKFSRHGGYARSPIKFEVVDDRFRDEEQINRRRSNLDTKLRQLSIEGPKNVNRPQAPVVRPLGEIIGKNASSLNVTTSSGEGSIDESPSEQKTHNRGNSIDLSIIKSQAFDTAAEVGPETPHLTQPSENNNWASFEASNKDNAPKTPNTNNTLKTCTTEETTPEAKFANPLDLLLFELSGPLVPSSDNVPTTTTVEKANNMSDFSPTSTKQTSASLPFELAQPSNAVPPPQAELHEVEDSIEILHADEPSSIQYPPSVSIGCSSTSQPPNALFIDVASSNEASVAPNNTHDSSHSFTELSSQTISKPTQDTTTDVGSQPSVVETKSGGRKELPEDLFSVSYISGGPAAPLAGWQNVQHPVMGYGMQYYPNAVPPSTLHIAPQSMNPFEVNEGKSLMHVSSFPSMAHLHGVLPTASPKTGLMHASSLGSLETMVSQSTGYASQVPSLHPFQSGVTTTGVCFDQVNNGEKQTRSPRVNTFNGDITGFGSIDTIQQSYGTPNSISNTTRGNPFE